MVQKKQIVGYLQSAAHSPPAQHWCLAPSNSALLLLTFLVTYFNVQSGLLCPEDASLLTAPMV